MYRNGIKRALDIMVSLAVLIVGAIPMALVILAIRLESPALRFLSRSASAETERSLTFTNSEACVWGQSTRAAVSIPTKMTAV